MDPHCRPGWRVAGTQIAWWASAIVRTWSDRSSSTSVGTVTACGRPALPCLFVLFAAFAPRLMLLIGWIARPNLIDSVFDTILLPLLGFIFLPFTTLMYVLLYLGGPTTGVSGTDWLWLAIAVVLDLSNHAHSFSQRNAVPGMSSGDTASAGATTAGAAAAAPMASPAAAPIAAPVTPVPTPAPAVPPAADVAPPPDEAPPTT